MSLEAMVWVLSGDAPVADVNEYAVLGAMADKADPDGCGTWLSKETIAARVHVSEETVKRCWRNMLKRGLIAKGDQSLVRHYRADRRPTVYDLLIPYTWFSNVDRINQERERLGRPPLTQADRPPLAPAPPKKQRADKGKPRPKKTTAPDQGASQRGNSQTPRAGASTTPHGGTTSRPRGNYKSSAGELEDPQNSQSNPSHDTGDEGGASVHPSVQEGDGRACGTEGRTDGRGVAIEDQEQRQAGAGEQETAAADAAPEDSSSGGEGGQRASVPAARSELTPGMEVLLHVGQAVPKLRLAGRVLTDQAARLDHLLATTPWTPADLYAALAAPFNGEIRTSAGAVVSARITGLPATPPRSSRADLELAAVPGASRSTASAADRSVAEAKARRVHDECRECGRLPDAGDLCAECAGWPLCDGCGIKRVTPGGGLCSLCTTTARPAPEPVGVCPGHDGTGCGTPVLQAGPLGLLCGRCEIAARRAKAQTDAEWEAARAAAIAAARAAEDAEQQEAAPLL
ncbi:hypothetical protein [Streptomyces fradiae]|uniref:hypothetical protein n=1 Tax=Streptomyces fradiae TaxID=1906 RepID=UPI0034065FC4